MRAAAAAAAAGAAAAAAEAAAAEHVHASERHEEEEEEEEAVWYFVDESRNKHGPLSLSQLATLRLSGDVHEWTLVWRPPMPVWSAYCEVGELPQPSGRGAAAADDGDDDDDSDDDSSEGMDEEEADRWVERERRLSESRPPTYSYGRWNKSNALHVLIWRTM